MALLGAHPLLHRSLLRGRARHLLPRALPRFLLRYDPRLFSGRLPLLLLALLVRRAPRFILAAGALRLFGACFATTHRTPVPVHDWTTVFPQHVVAKVVPGVVGVG